MFRAVNLKVPASPAADHRHGQHQQKHPHIAARFRLGLLRGGFPGFLRFHGFRLHARTLGHIDSADRAIRIDSPRHAFFRAGACGLFHPGSLRRSQQIGLVCHAQKVGFILLALLVHRLVIVNDNVKGVPARRLYRDKLLVGVLVIEQITGNKVALLREALARFNGGLRLRGRGFLGHSGIAIVFALTAVCIGKGRDSRKAA